MANATLNFHIFLILPKRFIHISEMRFPIVKIEKGRLDGAVCEYSEEDKMAYLTQVSQKVGIRRNETLNSSSGGDQHGDGGAGVRGSHPQGGNQVGGRLRHPSRQAPRRPGDDVLFD